MLMIGFLGGTWWAARRALRVKCDPDFVINMGFVALIASVIGARVFYVLHYWDTHFAGRGLWAAVDITQGGMEFYGGFLGGVFALLAYMLIKRAPIRLYLDIVAPSIMFGMGVTRIGCFLNGCCWGAACPAAVPWSVRFPYASPAAYRQWENRVITYPAELITFLSDGTATLIPRDEIAPMNSRQLAAQTEFRNTEAALEQAQAGHADPLKVTQLRESRDIARSKWLKAALGRSRMLRQESAYAVSDAELRHLATASESRTHTVHPAQLYSSLDGLLLAVLLSAVFYRRKQHGMVAGLVFLFYPFMRVLEEIIRSDNPHDVVGMTISQFISVAILVFGIAYMIAIYRMPANSATAMAPAAVPAERSSGRDRGKRAKAKK